MYPQELEALGFTYEAEFTESTKVYSPAREMSFLVPLHWSKITAKELIYYFTESIRQLNVTVEQMQKEKNILAGKVRELVKEWVVKYPMTIPRIETVVIETTYQCITTTTVSAKVIIEV